MREALEGRFDSEHALVVGQILAHIDFLDESIDRLSAAIEEQIAPFGGEMTDFATAGHLASWAGVCPGNDESAGKRRSGRPRKGSKWLGGTLIEAGRAAARTRDTCPAAQYQRVRARRGANCASLAVVHSLLIGVWHVVQTGETYTEPGGYWYTSHDPELTTRRLVANSNASPHRDLTRGAAG